MPKKSTAGLMAGALAATTANAAVTMETPEPVETDVIAGLSEDVVELALPDMLDDSLPEISEPAADGDLWEDPIRFAQTWGGGVGNDGVFAPRQGGGQRLEPSVGGGVTTGGGRRAQPSQPQVQQPKTGKNRGRRQGKGRKN